MAAFDGRDVFIAGAPSPVAVAGMFQDVFGLQPGQTVIEDRPHHTLLAAIDTGRWVSIWPLDPSGFFTVKAAMIFQDHIDTARFHTLAARYHVEVAYAVDESLANDFRCYVASVDGVRSGELSFRDTEHGYACGLIGSRPAR